MLIVLNPKWLCNDVIGKLLSFEHLSSVSSTGRLTADDIKMIFPKSDLGDMVLLLDTLGMCFSRSSQSEMEYDFPCCYKLGSGTELSTIWNATPAPDEVMGGVRVSSPQDFGDQISQVFSRVQVNMGSRLLYKQGNSSYSVTQWCGTSLIATGNMVAVIALRQSEGILEIWCRGPSAQRQNLFFFQEELCDVIFSSLDACCPGLYLYRGPTSARQLRDQRQSPYAYSPRTIFLAQLEGRTSVQADQDSEPEQLCDLFTYGSMETFTAMVLGVDLHVSCLSLYARYRLAALLDNKDPLGHDWCMLAVNFGLQDQIPRIETKETSALSKVDGILAIWSRSQYSTVRALHSKLKELQRADVVGELEQLASLFRYIAAQTEGDVTESNTKAVPT